MTTKLFKTAVAVAATAVAAGATILSAAPASAAYDGCPAWALCLYQHSGGTGSKAIITPPAAGGHVLSVSLVGNRFLNGDSAYRSVSSWINNSQCQVEFWDSNVPGLETGMQLDFAQSWHWGATGSYVPGASNYYSNDKLASVRFYCP